MRTFKLLTAFAVVGLFAGNALAATALCPSEYEAHGTYCYCHGGGSGYTGGVGRYQPGVGGSFPGCLACPPVSTGAVYNSLPPHNLDLTACFTYRDFPEGNGTVRKTCYYDDQQNDYTNCTFLRMVACNPGYYLPSGYNACEPVGSGWYSSYNWIIEEPAPGGMGTAEPQGQNGRIPCPTPTVSSFGEQNVVTITSDGLRLDTDTLDMPPTPIDTASSIDQCYKVFDRTGSDSTGGFELTPGYCQYGA